MCRYLIGSAIAASLPAPGEIVYPRAVKILMERDDLISELDELRGLKCGILKLGLPPVGSGTLFAKLFANYRKRYPGVDIRLVEHGSERLAEETALAGPPSVAMEMTKGVSLYLLKAIMNGRTAY